MPLYSTCIFFSLCVYVCVSVCIKPQGREVQLLDSQFAHSCVGGDWWECDGNPQPVRLISTIGMSSRSAMGDVGVLCWQQTVDLHVVVGQYGCT